MFRTDKPTEDAQSYIAMLENTPYEYDHTCSGCTKGFDSGFGAKIQDEKFCDHCLVADVPYNFYAECGLIVWEINEILNTYMVRL